MSKVKIQGHASGSGVLTITAPNTSTDRTITLPDATGTLLNSDGDGSSLTGVGVAGISSSADATAITINSSENVGIGDTTPTNAKLSIDNVLSGDAALAIKQDQANYGIDINQDGNGMAFHIDTAATTQPAIEVEANALTTGKGMLISSNSADTSTRQLLRVTNDHASATGTTLLYADNDSTGLVADFHGAGGIRSRYGIKFGTDTAAANALDDYEEGTFTPVFNIETGANFSTDSQVGHYTKIGRVVHVHIEIQIDKSGGINNVWVSGLPFNVKSTFNSHGQWLAGKYNNANYNHGARFAANTDRVFHVEKDASDGSKNFDTNSGTRFANSSNMMQVISGTYLT